MTVLSYIDALLGDVLPTPTGWKTDDSASMPPVLKPKTLYLFPSRLAPQRLDELDGVWDEAHLILRCVLAAPAKGEVRTERQDRATSEVLDNAVDALVLAVDANRRRTSDPRWWNLYVATITYEAIRNETVRAAFVDLVVRMVPPAGLA